MNFIKLQKFFQTYTTLLTTFATIGRNIVDIAVLLVISVIDAVIVARHIIIPQVGHPSKKFKLSPMAFDSPDTYK